MSKTPRQVWPSRWPRVTICCAFLPLITLVCLWQDVKPTLTPLQDYYLTRYIRSSLASAFEMKNRADLLYLVTAKHQAYPAMEGDLLASQSNTPVPFVITRRAFEQGVIRVVEYPVKTVTPRTMTTAKEYHDFLSSFFFDHQSVFQLYRWPFDVLLLLWIILIPLGVRTDWKLHKKARFGVKLRGPDLVNRQQFNRKVKGDGLQFIVEK